MHQAGPEHPSTEQLSAFSIGRVSDAELMEIATHLSGCPTCCAALDQLTSQDALLSRLQETDSCAETVLGDPSQRRAVLAAFLSGDKETRRQGER